MLPAHLAVRCTLKAAAAAVASALCTDWGARAPQDLHWGAHSGRSPSAPLDELLRLQLSYHPAWPGPHSHQPHLLPLPHSCPNCGGLDLPPAYPFPLLPPLSPQTYLLGREYVCACLHTGAQPPTPTNNIFSLYLCPPSTYALPRGDTKKDTYACTNRRQYTHT